MPFVRLSGLSRTESKPFTFGGIMSYGTCKEGAVFRSKYDVTIIVIVIAPTISNAP